MNTPKSTPHPGELGLPSRLEGLISLLIASPMSLLGCTPTEPLDPDDGGTTGSSMGTSTGSTGVADTDSTSIATTAVSGSSEGTTSTASTSLGTSEGSTSSSGSTDEGTTEAVGTSTTGGEQGNTCQRAGDVIDMCIGGGYGAYYEYYCNYAISYYIGIGDIECAQAHNEVYACIADLDCAQVAMGIYLACDVQYDHLYTVCYDWGETDGWGSGGITGGWGSSDGGWGGSGSGGWWGTTGGWGGSDSGGWPGTTT